jgi:hypothetical protein
MANVATLGIDIDKIIAKAKENGAAVARQITLSLQKKVIEKSPVDEGGVKGNWNVALNLIDTANYSDDKGGDTAIARALGELINFKPGDSIFITNNKPYIAALEFGLYGTGKGATEKTTRDGYSIQAPYGFIRITYKEVINDLDKIGRSAVK